MIRRLFSGRATPRRLTIWWMSVFVAAAAVFVVLKLTDDTRYMRQTTAALIALQPDEGGGWRAALIDAGPHINGFLEPIPAPPNHQVLLWNSLHWTPGSFGVRRESEQWHLGAAKVTDIPGSASQAATRGDGLPNDAWDAVVEVLENDVFDPDMKPLWNRSLLEEGHEFDVHATMWFHRRRTWNVKDFWRDLGGLAVTAALVACAACGLRFGIPLLIRRLPPGHCPSCGYDLTGLAPGPDSGKVTCPECGAASAFQKKT